MSDELIAWLKAQRTLSQREVDDRASQHDIDDLTPEERRSY